MSVCVFPGDFFKHYAQCSGVGLLTYDWRMTDGMIDWKQHFFQRTFTVNDDGRNWTVFCNPKSSVHTKEEYVLTPLVFNNILSCLKKTHNIYRNRKNDLIMYMFLKLFKISYKREYIHIYWQKVTYTRLFITRRFLATWGQCLTTFFSHRTT